MIRIAVLSAALVFGLSGQESPGQRESPDDPKTRVSLVSEHAALAPGRVNHIGIRVQMEPGWHVYFDGLNDTGMPLQAAWTAPEGVEIGKIVWPAPKRKVLGDFILDHVYEREVLLLVPIRVDEVLSGQRVEIAAEMSWLVCDEACLLESDRASLTMEVTRAGVEAGFSKARPLFEKTRQRLPRRESVGEDGKDGGSVEAGQDGSVRVRVEGETLIVEAEKADQIIFYPGPSCTRPANLIEDGAVQGQRLTVRFDGEPELVEGLIEVKRGQTSRIVRVRHPEKPEGGQAGGDAGGNE